jgi:hypothetical protein
MPRKSTMDRWYDEFMALTSEQRETAITVLAELNRQATRRALSAPAQPQQLTIKESHGQEAINPIAGTNSTQAAREKEAETPNIA